MRHIKRQKNVIIFKFGIHYHPCLPAAKVTAGGRQRSQARFSSDKAIQGSAEVISSTFSWQRASTMGNSDIDAK
jgi:hypothetical protein